MHSYLHDHPALLHAVKDLERLNPDQFELFFQRVSTAQIDSKNQEVDSLSRAEDVGLAIRVIKDRRLGFSYTTSLEKEPISRAIQSALEIAALMPEDEHVGLFNFGTAVYPEVDAFDHKGVKVPMSAKISLAQDLEAQCRKSDKRVTAIRSASIQEKQIERHLVDSSGEQVHHQCTLYTASVTCKAEQQGDSQMGHEWGYSHFLDGLDIRGVGETAARWATELLGSSAAPTMRCSAVLRNSVVAELLEFLSSSFSAEQIDKGRSILAGKQGQRLFSDQVTLIDDGLLPGGFGSFPFDGEGIPSTQTVLVDGGFIQRILCDGYFGRKLGKDPTGSSQRGIKGPPSIGPSNLYMRAGKVSPGELVSGISKGILITDLMGVHTANPVTGDFSLGASGLLIENGKLSKPVRGFAVAGNILEVFRKITDISNDLLFFGSMGAPSVRIAEISLGGM